MEDPGAAISTPGPVLENDDQASLLVVEATARQEGYLAG